MKRFVVVLLVLPFLINCTPDEKEKQKETKQKTSTTKTKTDKKEKARKSTIPGLLQILISLME